MGINSCNYYFVHLSNGDLNKNLNSGQGSVSIYQGDKLILLISYKQSVPLPLGGKGPVRITKYWNKMCHYKAGVNIKYIHFKQKIMTFCIDCNSAHVIWSNN